MGKSNDSISEDNMSIELQFALLWLFLLLSISLIVGCIVGLMREVFLYHLGEKSQVDYGYWIFFTLVGVLFTILNIFNISLMYQLEELRRLYGG